MTQIRHRFSVDGHTIKADLTRVRHTKPRFLTSYQTPLATPSRTRRAPGGMPLLTEGTSTDLASIVLKFSSCIQSKAGTMKVRDYLWGLGRNGLLFAGFVIILIFWLLEASNHVLFFADSDVVEAVFAPSWHEIWMRLAVVTAIMTFAVIANYIVNARRKAEDAATRALSEVDQVFETAADGMRIVDRNFRVLKANETFAKLVGLPKNEIIGKKCHDVFWGEMCESAGCPLTRILEGEQDVEYDLSLIHI